MNQLVQMMQSVIMQSGQQSAGANPAMRQSMQQMPVPNPVATPPVAAVTNSLDNLFNDVARNKPNMAQAPADPYNPFGSGNQSGQPGDSQNAQQNNNQYNPFDL